MKDPKSIADQLQTLSAADFKLACILAIAISFDLIAKEQIQAWPGLEDIRAKIDAIRNS